MFSTEVALNCLAWGVIVLCFAAGYIAGRLR